MGYACPVCGDPQSDGEHLANHLAFTAMLGDDDHEEWLDERVADWGSLGPDELAPRVTERAEETEFPQVFEDTTGDGHGHDHGDGREHALGHGERGGQSTPPSLDGRSVGDPGAYDAEADPDDVIAEATEMTRRMRDDTEESDESDRTASDDAAESDDDAAADSSSNGSTDASDDG